jgi:hypothetical protein
MEISIMCDQKDCIYNAGHNVHHDHHNDACEHMCPQLAFAPGFSRVCFSKYVRNTGTTHTGALLPTNPKTT